MKLPPPLIVTEVEPAVRITPATVTPAEVSVDEGTSCATMVELVSTPPLQTFRERLFVFPVAAVV